MCAEFEAVREFFVQTTQRPTEATLQTFFKILSLHIGPGITESNSSAPFLKISQKATEPPYRGELPVSGPILFRVFQATWRFVDAARDRF